MPPDPHGFADVSVVIPAYRAAATIGRALASVANQTVKPREVIVVVDGSPDETAAQAEAAAKQLSGTDLHVLRVTHGGAGFARNRGLERASAQFVAFLDADDEWLPDKLERSLAEIVDTRRVLVAHDGWIHDGDNATLNECARRFRESGDPYVNLYRKGYIDTCSVVIRRAAALGAGGFDETLPNAQDFELWLALLKDPAAQFHVFEAPLVRYHVSEHGIMSRTDSRLRCGLRIAVRHAASLRAHPGSVVASLWFRITAIHYEAACSYARRRQFLRLAGLLVQAPVNLVRATFLHLSGRAKPRAAFIEAALAHRCADAPS
ncbi:MAG: glycosyltransferase family 2 protein [Rhodospirillales bacterium]|jgi:glycosyltransferase involved in cell wall biosynthesis|nr:glycosyltransferase family 2 protein [Rhodospirillales bacterium]